MTDLDLDLVRELRADVPFPSDERLAVGRERLLRSITPASPQRFRQRLLRPHYVWAGVLAAAAAAVVAVAGLDVHRAVPGPQDTLAAEVLRTAAATVARAPARQPDRHQWLYQRFLESDVGQAAQRNDTWLRFDGGADAVMQNGRLVVDKKPLTPAGRAAALSVYKGDPTPMHAYEALAALPSNPRALLATVEAAASTSYDPNGLPTLGAVSAHSPDQLQFEFLVQLLWQTGGTQPPRTEAAVFDALAAIPHVTTQRGIHDAFGRPAIGLSDNSEIQLLLDPRTYAALGLRTISTGTAPHLPNSDMTYPRGTVLQSMARQVSVVNAPGQR